MNQIQLPIWLEYIKAIGTPIVALFAALIAGWIAYRQWVTARNKLKLDFFDRRMAIYTAAVNVINWMVDADYDKKECLKELRNLIPMSRWLLGCTISDHLNNLMKKANKIPKNKSPDEDYHYFFRIGHNEEAEKILNILLSYRLKELKELDSLFEPYLTVQH